MKMNKVAMMMLTAGCGGMLFDFGGTVINPAIPYFESLKLFTTAQISHLTSAVVLSAAFAGLIAGVCAETFGRKRTMLFASVLAALACLPICLGGTYPLLYLGRVLQGVAAGLIGVVVPMYLAECLPADLRGKGAGMFQFMDVVGILFCSLVGLAVVFAIGPADGPAVTAAAKHAAWKTIFWSSAVPAVVFFLGALGLDESPVWREKKARATAGAGEAAAVKPAEKGSLLRRKYVLPFALALAVLFCNQATGCNAIQYYALKMFQDAGLSNKVASFANVALWGAMLGMTVVGGLLVDRRGRKTLLAIGTSAMIVANLLAGNVFLALAKGWLAPSAFSGALAVAGVTLFICGFSVGPGVVVWLALSELMPDRIRANGMAIGLFVNMLTAYLISDVFLVWVEKCGYYTVLFSLAGFALLYLLVAIFLLPETKGKTLEEIEAFFAK
jgi:MFS family permease